MSKAAITSMITSMSKLPEVYPTSESDSEGDIAEVQLQLSLKERLDRALNKDASSAITQFAKTTKNKSNVIKKELAIFEVEGNWGKNHLDRCYDSLLSIPPTSVESERVFSGYGNQNQIIAERRNFRYFVLSSTH